MNPTIFVMVVANHFQYDDHTIGVTGKTGSFILEDNSGWIPMAQENYIVQNIGRVDVNAELWYGEVFSWLNIVTEDIIRPGEKKVLDNEGSAYYYTGLKIINNNTTRAIVHAEGGDLPNPFVPPKIDINWWIKKIAYFAIKKIPYGRTFVKLLDMFWPKDKPNVWKNITDDVTPLLKKEELQIIQSLLQNDILYYRDQITSLQDELKNVNKTQEHYMHIAYSLVGFELKFKMPNTIEDYKVVNFRLLPLYTNVVSMKMHFYTLGIQNKEEIGLTDDSIANIKRYMNRTVTSASKYINTMLKWPVDDAYNTSAAEGIFDTMMSIRTHLAIHGEEYLPFWNHMLKEPFSNGTDIYNDVISFSDFFGRPTANLYAQATPEEVLEPLKPRLIDGKRNRLVNIIVYLCETGIAGIKLTFESQDIYDLGTYTKKSDGFDLRDTYIDRLIAFGEGKIDGLKFILDDGRNLMFGEVTSSSFETFELPDHHIASLYLASDTRDLDGNAANIAVSYQWKNK